MQSESPRNKLLRQICLTCAYAEGKLLHPDGHPSAKWKQWYRYEWYAHFDAKFQTLTVSWNFFLAFLSAARMEMGLEMGDEDGFVFGT